MGTVGECLDLFDCQAGEEFYGSSWLIVAAYFFFCAGPYCKRLLPERSFSETTGPVPSLGRRIEGYQQGWSIHWDPPCDHKVPQIHLHIEYSAIAEYARRGCYAHS